MLDTIMRPIIDPPLNKAGEVIARFGVPANTVTVTGFTFGMIAAIIASLLVARAGGTKLAALDQSLMWYPLRERSAADGPNEDDSKVSGEVLLRVQLILPGARGFS